MRRIHATTARESRLGLWAVVLLAALVYLPTLAWLVHRWSLGVWFHVHGFVVFPLAIWLAWKRLKETPGLDSRPSAWGFALLGPAVALQILDALLGFQLLSAISLVIAVFGLCLLLLGKERTRAIWFPLFFLLFAVPIPLFLATRIHGILRQVAAVGTHRVLDLLGYDVTRDGTALQVGPDSIQIADACSGFSTLTALFMVGMLLPYLARLRPLRAATLVAFVFPIAALANVVRCVVLIMLVAAFDPEILDSPLHPLSGIATFVLALVLLLQLEKLLTRERKE